MITPASSWATAATTSNRTAEVSEGGRCDGEIRGGWRVLFQTLRRLYCNMREDTTLPAAAAAAAVHAVSIFPFGSGMVMCAREGESERDTI